VELADLGRQVALARGQRGLTQAALASACGLSRQTVCGLERGELGDLGIRKLARLLEVLDLALVLRPRAHLVTLDDLRAEP
jgi:transcriptional regulator with XRE-family HTH domain